MSNPSALALVAGCSTATVCALLYGRFDQSLAYYAWWKHYAPRKAKSTRLLLCGTHAVVGLASALILALVTDWYPFGTHLWQLICAGLAWSAAGEALLRAEAVTLDLGRSKPGVSLLRKILTQQFVSLEAAVGEEIDRRLLIQADTDAELIGLLVTLLGLDLSGGSIAAMGKATAVKELSRRLRSTDRSNRDAARVDGLAVAKSIILETKKKLDPVSEPSV
jgi:hypothetical protein